MFTIFIKLSCLYHVGVTGVVKTVGKSPVVPHLHLLRSLMLNGLALLHSLIVIRQPEFAFLFHPLKLLYGLKPTNISRAQ